MLNAEQAAIVKGMLARGDNQHDIAATLGENQGRIAEIKNGLKFRDVKPAPYSALPPTKQARYIDPNAPAEKQFEILREFITKPPENSRIITITSALAQQILETLNNNNRRQRPSNIKRFVAAMETGNWQLTGDTIKFSRSGFLLDGQNRLKACMRSGYSFRTHVVFGIADDAFSKIDTNAVRTNGDTFQIAGIPYSGVVGPAVRWLMIGNDRGRKVENQELLDYYRANVDADRMDEAARNAVTVGKAMSPSALAAHLYLFKSRDAKTCARFVSDLMKRRHGGKKLLDKIERIKQQNMGRIHEVQVNAMIIQAWNAYRAGKMPTFAVLNWHENKEYPAIM